MSEFKFACPVCGQRMAVDSSASGAQVECPTCFQIIIVPKAPAAGSKYQLSATQFIKPVVLPPPPKPATTPVRSQRKSAVLIFGLILACAIVTALLIREKIIGAQQEQAAAGSTNETSQASSAVNPLWTLNLTNTAIPDRPAAGEIHGKNFVCREAIWANDFLGLRSSPGRQSGMAVSVYPFRNNDFPERAERLNGRVFEITASQTGSLPVIALYWRDGDMRVTEMFTNGYSMKLEFGAVSSNRLPGKIYLCLPDKTKSCVVGTFSAQIRNFGPRRRP